MEYEIIFMPDAIRSASRLGVHCSKDKNCSGKNPMENDIDEYNSYILSEEFKEEYSKLWEKYYPNVNPVLNVHPLITS